KLHDVARADGNPETLLLYDAQQQLLRQALEALPVAFREVIILRDLEGLPYCTHRGKAMKALVLTLIVCVTCAILMASAQSPQPATLTLTKGVTPLPVAVDGLQVRVEGA